MKAINKYLEQFEAYQNGDLAPEEVQAFLKARDQNQEMLDAWNEYSDMMKALSDREAVSLRGKLEGAFYKQQDNKIRFMSQSVWLRASSAAMIMVVMGALLYFFCSNNNSFFGLSDDQQLGISDTNSSINIYPHDTVDNQDAVIPIKEVVKVQKKDKIASIYSNEEYQISPIFVELLHNVYRSGWFDLRSPQDSVIFTSGDSIVFSWETNIRNPVYFDILDRNGKVVFKHPNPISTPWTYKPDLSPAIYMLRFSTEEQPVWMGVMVGK